jgi:hypothetical protein
MRLNSHNGSEKRKEEGPSDHRNTIIEEKHISRKQARHQKSQKKLTEAYRRAALQPVGNVQRTLQQRRVSTSLCAESERTITDKTRMTDEKSEMQEGNSEKIYENFSAVKKKVCIAQLLG